jgi:carbamoyl-phosphate synthase large subunit
MRSVNSPSSFVLHLRWGEAAAVSHTILKNSVRSWRTDLIQSPTHEVLVEESVLGWKEYELEVMRDTKDNVVIICSIENFDPMGVHTGDSITVAPAQTLTDKEYQFMRDAASESDACYRCGYRRIQCSVRNGPEQRQNVCDRDESARLAQLGLSHRKRRDSRSQRSPPKLAVGYTLDEIPNDITKLTPASFEPTIDYTVVKIPRWDFEKFKGVDDSLGVQMKSVGEAMAFGRTFKEALQKTLRSLEQGRFGLGADGKDHFDVDTLTKIAADNVDQNGEGAAPPAESEQYLLCAICISTWTVIRRGTLAHEDRSVVPL